MGLMCGRVPHEDSSDSKNLYTTEPDGLAALAASATSGRSPPAGPEWRRKSTPRSPAVAAALHYDKPLCASLDGFTLHAATRAGAMGSVGREALCKYVLRPPIAQERVTHGPDGLVRITLKKPFADGTVAVDMDPLSLLSRLAAAVPPPRLHTVRYVGVLAPESKLRPRIVPRPSVAPDEGEDEPPDAEKPAKPAGSRYRPWPSSSSAPSRSTSSHVPGVADACASSRSSPRRRPCAASSAASAKRPRRLLGHLLGDIRTGGGASYEEPPARCRWRSDGTVRSGVMGTCVLRGRASPRGRRLGVGSSLRETHEE